MTSTSSPPRQAVRRRASRAAGPANGGAAATTTVRVEPTIDAPAAKPARKTLRPPRRLPHARLVAIIALALAVVGTAVVGAAVTLMFIQQRHADSVQARNQRFIDAGAQTVVNMFSFRPDTVEDNVNRFYKGTSGPLHDMLSQSNNVENLKAIFRDTGGSSEAVVNGAALESVDSVSDNASVLVSVRVTVSDGNGNNKPSQPYRMRVIVHEDDNGQMTAYDLKYPNGGN